MLHDKDIREPLFEYLEGAYGKSRFIEEKTMGRSRADIVMVLPSEVIGIEIKSDADTYARLASQIKDYDRYYDRNIVVAGSSHAMHVEEHVPDHWGIITAEMEDGVFDFYMLRRPQPNPKCRLGKKLEILWRPELAMLQEQNGMPKYKAESKDFVIKKICKWADSGKLEAAALQKQISDILFERDYNTVDLMLKEYRKGEMQKQIENERDPVKRQELIDRRDRMREKGFGKRRRRRRKRSLLSELS